MLREENIKSYRYGSETVSNLGAKLWDIIPGNIKKTESLQEFKNKIFDSVKLPVQTVYS